MAIVFISPKQKRKTFFKFIGAAVGLLVLVIGFIFFITDFLPKSKVPVIDVSSGGADMKINFTVVDSEKVKNLEPFDYLEMNFAYIVLDADGREVSGNVSSITQEDARKLLEEGGFKVISLKEAGAGQPQPFTSF